MAFTLDDVLAGIRESRAFFFKHLKDLTEEQWVWKPYPECKSPRETLVHMLVNDRAALSSLASGEEPDYEGISSAATAETGSESPARLLERLTASHAQLCAWFQQHHADTPLDTEISMWGTHKKLGAAVAYLSSEDFYHSGQVAYIRLATDPAWNYYKEIYGFEG